MPNVLPEVPWTTTGHFFLGFIGVMGVVALFLMIWNQGKKAFGRTPPISEELDKRDKTLRKMIFASENSMKERLTRLENLYVEMQADRLRKWEQLQAEISEVAENVAFIRGRWESDKNKS